MAWIILTLLVAAAGGLLLSKCKVPGGMLIGAILGVTLLNVTTGQAYIWSQARIVVQVLTGAYIGCMVTREDLMRLPMVFKPYITVMLSFLVLNLLVAMFIYRSTDLDLLTCLFCAMPGGMTDTPLVAMDMGADASMVAVMQFVRMIFGIGCLPAIILISDRLLGPKQETVLKKQDEQASKTQGALKKEVKQGSLKAFLPTFFIALCAGLVGKRIGLPAGTMSFSLIAVIIIKFLKTVPPMPKWVRKAAQVVSGCCIGAGITQEQILQVCQMILPAIVLCLGYSICCVGMGYVLSRVFHIDLREAMLCLSPAGATEMALIAADLGVHSTNLVVLQIFRLLGVVVIFPQIFTVLVRIFG